ncbi:MAG: translation elongation factor 4 [Planctomycetes bacterium]|nr:translation elongation factor 4 [Planctomycetota bacterium]
MSRDLIRNFSIIAHIDHGKSTLADRLLELTGAIVHHDSKNQVLDKMDLEQERGITIKAQTVRLSYRARDGKTYQLNLIDTPGHVDFHYEVSRSLAACEGALLVVDATQGVEAQTLANVYMALDNNLEIVPILNKIDRTSADPERVKEQIEEIIGIEATDALEISAKTGLGTPEVLEAIVQRIPPPKKGGEDEPLCALIYDSWFDSYLGAVIQVRVISGCLRPNDRIRFISTGAVHEVYKLGIFNPHDREIPWLRSGEVGYFSCAMKNLKEVKIGDTLVHARDESTLPLPGFKEVKPMVFGGLFPVQADDYEDLRSALDKLGLNDPSFTFEPETSAALGFGFRCGYLGLLHMEIIQERLEREFELNLITTAPSVVFRIKRKDGGILHIDNPVRLPPLNEIEQIEELRVTATLHCPKEYVGVVLALCEDRRGKQKSLSFHGGTRAVIVYDLPFHEIILDFHDRLKSLTKGYASFDYEPRAYEPADMVKLDIKLNYENVDALSTILHKSQAYQKGRALTEKLQELIERQLYDVAIQATIGNKVVARSTVKALRKDVTAKCYGGDITRKRKLLEKQKKGKKRMKQVGKVAIPQEAFLAVLKMGDSG